MLPPIVWINATQYINSEFVISHCHSPVDWTGPQLLPVKRLADFPALLPIKAEGRSPPSFLFRMPSDKAQFRYSDRYDDGVYQYR